jgi:hypothetical protein
MSYTELLLVVWFRLWGEDEPPRGGAGRPRAWIARAWRRFSEADRAGDEALLRVRRGAARRDRKAGNAELRDEVALLSGLAAAIDEYEHAPHDGATVRRLRGSRTSIAQVAHHARRLSRDGRLGT